jgi:hypothetical protein
LSEIAKATIGFFGAHRQAVENLLPVATTARRLGAEVLFLDADPLFHQSTNDLIHGAGFSSLPITSLTLPRPLALYGGAARARAMLGLRRAIGERARAARVWMICGDNAPHRALMELAPRGRFCVAMADAVFAEARLPWWLIARHGAFRDYVARVMGPLRTTVLHAAGVAHVSWLLPGRSGHSAADLMVLAGQYSMDVVRASRGNVQLYWPIGLPRFAAVRPAPQGAVPPCDRRLRVAVFPSAFSWHGHQAEQAMQDAVMRELAAAFTDHGDALEVLVKKHPRESNDLYGQLAATYPGIEVDFQSDAATVMAWADAIVTLLSSVALEAVLIGKPAVLAGWGLPWWRMHGTPFTHPAFPRPTSATALVDELLALRTPAAFQRAAERQRELRDYLFAPTTPQAAERVARVLVAALDSHGEARRLAQEWGATPL